MRKVLTDKLIYLQPWILVAILLCAGIKEAHGQEQAYFSQYMHYRMVY